MALGRGHLRRDSALRWRASRSASRSNTAATVRSDRTWSRSPVRPVTWRSRVSGSWPCSAASVRHRPYKVSAAWWSLGLRVAWTAHLTSRGVRSRPRGLQPLHLQVNPVRSLGVQPDQVLGQALQLPVPVGVRCCPLDPERPGQLALVAGPIDGIGGQPMPIQVRPSNAVQRPSGPWTPLATTRWGAAAGRPPGTSDGRTRPPAAPVRPRARVRRGHAASQCGCPGRRPPQPRRHGGPPRPPGRWPGRPGRKGSTRSWSAAGPRRSLARPGDSPWPDRYCSWSVASSRV
jgi:hypothetical protein